jgi:hypothetical protein
MTKEQLLKRKTVLEKQIKMWENRIVQEKNKEKEKVLFVTLNSLKASLDKIKKQLEE